MPSVLICATIKDENKDAIKEDLLIIMSSSKLSDSKKLFGFWATSCLMEIILCTPLVDLKIRCLYSFIFKCQSSFLCSIEMKAERLIVCLRNSISCLLERSNQLITLQIQGYFIHLNLEGSIHRTKNLTWFLVILTHNLWIIKYDAFKVKRHNLGGVHVVSFKC